MEEKKQKIHPIILNNKQYQRHWFSARGTYVDAFVGLDGKVYTAEISPDIWTPEIRELYKKEGVKENATTLDEEILSYIFEYIGYRINEDQKCKPDDATMR